MERRGVFIITLHNSSHFKRIRRSHALGVTSPGWIFSFRFRYFSISKNLQNKFTTVFNIYGRVPFFYYVLHFYIIHLIAVIIFFINGFASSQIVTPGSPFFFRPPELGYGLIGVYVIWIIVVLILYPMCKKYDIYKTSHIKLKWWLRYF